MSRSPTCPFFELGSLISRALEGWGAGTQCPIASRTLTCHRLLYLQECGLEACPDP